MVSITRPQTSFEKEEIIDLDTALDNTLNLMMEDIEKRITARNRTILKNSKEVKSEKLCCWRHAKLYIKNTMEVSSKLTEDQLNELFSNNCFLEYGDYKYDINSHKDLRGFPVTVETIHLDFRCRKCEFGMSFSFESRQLQPETLNLIDKSSMDA